MIQTLNPRKARELDKEIPVKNPVPAHKDGLYVVFLIALALFGFIFVQYFLDHSLYYKEVHQLSEKKHRFVAGNERSAYLFLRNATYCIFRENKYVKSRQCNQWFHTNWNKLLLLLVTPWAGILIIGMIAATLGEMVAFPFGNAFALDRSKKRTSRSIHGIV